MVSGTPLAQMNLANKGVYEIVVEYHSPVAQSGSFGLAAWTSERGTIRSNSVRIAVGD